jgi:BirA family biotin operon repressor/biotin-[acetyl-CoA-carboxylase] ligase
MKQTLVDFDEEVWLKWPNDFYYKHEKVGGTITQKVGDVVVCGMGINLKKTSNAYASLETTIDPKVLLEAYLKSLEKFPSWKQIFSEYEIEFEKSRAFSAHIENQKTNLLEAILCQDGSLIINQKKVFSLR